MISLGVAVIRARDFPRWVSGLLILSLPLSLVQLPGPLAEIGDYLAFFALAVIGWIVVFGRSPQPAVAPGMAPSLTGGGLIL